MLQGHYASNMEWIKWMKCVSSHVIFVLLFVGSFYKTTLTNATEVNGNADNCVISVVIPRDSVKTSCSSDSRNELKLRSVEGIISQLRREMNEIKVKLAYTLSRNSDAKDITNLFEKVSSIEKVELVSIEKRLTIIEDRLEAFDQSQKINNPRGKATPSKFSQNLSKKKLSKIVKTILTKELSGLDEKIKASLLEELQTRQDLPAANMRHAQDRESPIANAKSDRLYRQYNRQDIPQPRLVSVSENSLEEIAEDNAHLDEVLPKIRHDSVQSAIDNEFPDIHVKTDITQSDSDFGNGMNKLFEIFRNELTDSLAQQTQRVKDITTQHLTTVETKMSRLVRVIDGMKNKYNEHSVPHRNNAISSKLRGKIEELEAHISTLAQGIASMKESVFNDPIMEERFMQQQLEIENRIISKLYQSNIPSKQELETLRTELSEASRKVDITDASLKNYKADMRIKTHFLEHNLTLLVNSLEYMNETLFPDYEEAFDLQKHRREMEVNSALKFVKEVKQLWPYSVQNLTEKELMDEINRHEIELEFVEVKTKVLDLSKKDEQFEADIYSMNYTINTLTDRISDIEKYNLNNALEHNKWVRFNFNSTFGRSGCFGGKKYIRKTKYRPAQFVGVVLCSEKRYKIYLSDSLDSTFLDLGDTLRGGEDHCEFVGATENSRITVGHGEPVFDSVEGYKRSQWGESPVKGTLSFYTPTPPWYECGVTIP